MIDDVPSLSPNLHVHGISHAFPEPEPSGGCIGDGSNTVGWFEKMSCYQRDTSIWVCVCVSKAITINVSGVFPPINPSYFDVHQGYKVLTQSHMTLSDPQRGVGLYRLGLAR